MMLNPWFTFGLASARRGLEAQSAFVASLLRMVGGDPPEPPRPIDNTEQIDSAVPALQPPTGGTTSTQSLSVQRYVRV